MKKCIKILAIALILMAATGLLSCDADIPEEIVQRIPYDFEKWHDHTWDNWAIGYTEEDVSLVLNHVELPCFPTISCTVITIFLWFLFANHSCYV